jgi:DNA-binding CsgD family transcriptional regulator
VLRLLAEGKSSREIGDLLFISHRTATTHVTNMFGKLDVDNRAAAVAKGYQLGLL